MTIANGHIDLWPVYLDGGGTWGWLSRREQAFAAAAMDPAVRRRRICARSSLRDILGRYVSRRPGAVPIEIRAGGKPYLPGGPPFSLSHCGDFMLVAVSGVGEVGLDVEASDRLDADWYTVAARSFSPVERAEIARLAPAQPLAALRTWVRKEAYAKARGAGYAYGFASFTVRASEASSAPLLVEDANDKEATSAWCIIDLGVPRGYFASLAHAGLEANICPRPISR